MRYADTLLTEGEVIVLRTRQHWLALIVRSRAALLLWLAGIVLLGLIIFFNVQQEVLRNIVSGVALVMLGLGVVIFVYRLWHWWAQDYVVTNRRLLKVTGILNKRSADSSLEKINDAILSQPLLGRILNYGDLEILTAAEMAVDLYRMINAPKQFKKVMLTQKHALETEFMYGRPPSPPLRATDEQTTQRPPQPMMPERPAEQTPMAAVAPEPVASAPAAAPMVPVAAALAAEPQSAAAAGATSEEDESLEVTELLARLADLRDEGAITPEEYEQKKDELLSRL